MIFLIYSLTAAALLWLIHRFVRRLSRPASLFLYLLPFLLTGYALVAGRVYAPVDQPYVTEPLSELKADYGIDKRHNGFLTDIHSQMIPWRKAVQWSLEQGEWPLWNPFQLSGDVLAAAAQPAAYSPFTLLACLLPVAQSFTFTAAIAFFIAGAGAFLLARELDCGEMASAIAAIGWAYSAGMAFFVLWPLAFSWAYFPMVLLAARRVVSAPDVASGGLLATILTLLILAGHPETVLHVVSGGCAYALFELIRARRPPLRALVVAMTGAVIALLLSAIYLLPFLEAVPQTSEYAHKRAIFAEADRAASTTTVVARLATDIFPFLQFRAWIKPDAGSMTIESATAGSIILALALLAVWRVRTATTWFFAAMAVVFIVIHTEFGPLQRLLQNLPLFDLALNHRFFFGAACCLAILGALGAEHLARDDNRRAAAVTFAIVLAVLIAGTFAIPRLVVLSDGYAPWITRKIIGELALLAAAVVLLLTRVPARFVLPGLLVLLTIQRAVEEGDNYRSFPSRVAYPPVPLFAPLAAIREPFRIVGHGYALVPATGALYELEDVRGYEAMTFRQYVETYGSWCEAQPAWFNRVDDLSRPFLSMLNVRFAIASKTAGVPEGWRVFNTMGGSVLLENTKAIERAFVPRQVTFGMDHGAVTNAMQAASDFREHAWITAPVDVHTRPNGPGHVQIQRAGTAYRLDVEMENDGWVVVSETAWDGWRAFLAGHRVTTQKANIAFLSMFVPRGRHTVRLTYLPQSFVTGRALTSTTLAAIVLAGAWHAARRRSAR